MKNNRQKGLVIMVVMVMLMLLSVASSLMLMTAMASERTGKVYAFEHVAFQAAESILSGTIRELSRAIRLSGSATGLLETVLHGNDTTIRCFGSYQNGYDSLSEIGGEEPETFCGGVQWQLDENNNISTIEYSYSSQNSFGATGGVSALSIFRHREDLDSQGGEDWQVFEVIAIGRAGESEQISVQQLSVFMGYAGDPGVSMVINGTEMYEEGSISTSRLTPDVMRFENWYSLPGI